MKSDRCSLFTKSEQDGAFFSLSLSLSDGVISQPRCAFYFYTDARTRLCGTHPDSAAPSWLLDAANGGNGQRERERGSWREEKFRWMKDDVMVRVDGLLMMTCSK